MKNGFEKTLILPLVIGLRPQGLALPGTVPLAPQQQAVAGMVKWAAPEWDKAEYEKVQRTVDGTITTSPGIGVEKLVVKIAEAVHKAIPDRNFSVTIGSFGIEYKGKEKGGTK